MKSDTKHLIQNDSGVWLFRRRVPEKLKRFFPGLKFLKQSLETKSLTQARVKRDALNTQIELKLQEETSGLSLKNRFQALYTEMKPFYDEGRRMVREGKWDENFFYDSFDPDLQRKENDETYKAAYYSIVHNEVPERFRLKISELTSEWLKANEGKKDEKYCSTVQTASKFLIEFLGGDELPENVSPGYAQGFLDKLIEGGRSSGTVTHYKSKLAEIWRWGLTREKFSGTNPWKEVKVEAPSEQKEQDHFRNLTTKEARILLQATTLEAQGASWPYPFTTFALVRLLPFLGCRRSELGQAMKDQLQEHDGHLFFEVRKGKTKNAQRIIPVSPVIEPLLRETVDRAGESPWLFPEVGEAEGMTPSKALNSISSHISSITSNFEKVEGTKVSLHSLRGHFATALEEIGCPEELAVKLAGHKRISLTYGLYSKYKNKEQLWKYIEQIHRAECLEAWVS
ncbi:tyrosine-type recombinase/integrase [Aliiglaciecola sp. CAU 1673]|uniref:tyrosine-type recombinase/integrase n=1 Tax=Aliiglaciecola sp. CAU 1673 TaxID=3032595 RepID=UPI0023DC9A3C|nr:tyrosine-type recombinase/integrase [Aliiglaciecola sp. CAU 1673]MDF2176990.1 tyrosine-type recombinase/integrase [Aliiglaciecola sp. CAU 1673]